MAGRQKKVLFCVAGLLSCACVLLVAAAVGTQAWVRAAVLCKTGAQIVNASGAELHKFTGSARYGLFSGRGMKQCGLGDRAFSFSFFPDLMHVVPVGLHVSIIFICGVLILFSGVSAVFFFYNAFGKPYETLHGPHGLYLWNTISCVCGCLVLILFASEVKLHHLTEIVSNFGEGSFVYKTQQESLDRSFWLVFLVFLTHGLSVLLVRLAGVRFPFQEAKESQANTGAADLMY